MGISFLDHIFKPFFILGVVIFLSFIAKESLATGNIHFESLKIMPSITVGREYSDNYFPRDFKMVIGQDGKEKIVKIKTAESVVKIKPSLDFLLPFGQNSFNLHYELNSYNFQDLKKYDTNNHAIGANLEWHFISGLTAKVSDWSTIAAASIPVHIYEDVRHYHDNKLSVIASYELGRRYTSEMQFDNSFIRWQENQFKQDNTNDKMITSRILYQIMPKTFIGFEYAHERYNRKDLPGENTDYTAHDYWVIMKFDDPTGRLNGQLKAGIQNLVYDDKTLNTGNNFFGFNADLTFNKSKYTSIVFSGQRFQATTGVVTEDAQYGASFTNTMLSLGLTHKFTYKISGTVNFAYTELEFNTEGSATADGTTQAMSMQRKDNEKKWGGELNYQMRDWLGFKVKYIHSDHNSNVPQEAFKRNQFMTEISFKF
jgi:hypothetical protein